MRDVGTASSKDMVGHAGDGATQRHREAGPVTPQAEHMAMCLLRNPRPPRPSYNCPFGCPWHEQVLPLVEEEVVVGLVVVVVVVGRGDVVRR